MEGRSTNKLDEVQGDITFLPTLEEGWVMPVRHSKCFADPFLSCANK